MTNKPQRTSAGRLYTLTQCLKFLQFFMWSLSSLSTKSVTTNFIHVAVECTLHITGQFIVNRKKLMLVTLGTLKGHYIFFFPFPFGVNLK